MTVLWATEELPGLTWDPEPDDEDNGPWCSSMPPEPCDTGEPAATTVAPLGWRDLYGQISADELILRRMDILTTEGEWL